MILSEFNKNITSFLPEGVEGKRFLLAVSGGIDSMCMASLFLASELDLQFGIATVNFKLREGDCDLDQALVRDWAEERGIPFHTIEFDTERYAEEHSISTQMAARDLRYGWFYQLLEEHKYDYIAIAHNMDDSAETLLLNLIRGTGVKGLAGIRKVNGKVIRPLISVSREDIVEYVSKNNVPYRDDKTNFESHYFRNRVRNIIFPEIKKINPSFLKTISRTSSYFIQAEEVLDELYEAKRDVLCREENGCLIVDVPLLMREKHQEYWLHRMLGEKGFNSSQISDIKGAMGGQSGKVFSSAGYELLVDRGELKVYPLERANGETFSIDSPGVYTFGEVTFEIRFIEKTEEFHPFPKDGTLYFSADSIELPLVCRGWQKGDRFRPFGMTGFKKMSDFFKDAKMDKRSKETQPLLLCGEDIVCLPGVRIDDRYKIKTSTRMVAEVNILK